MLTRWVKRRRVAKCAADCSITRILPENIEGQGKDVQREEKGVQKAIREAAKRNDMGSAKALAKEIVMSRKAVNRLYENKAQLNSISMHLGESVAIARTVGHLSKSAEVMKLVNNLMKAPQMAATMQEFSKEMIKEEAIVEGADDEEELEEIRARLARVRS
ncbi:hypothetical protein Goshw_007995 [Gossypium schwendimanii]|uniref:Uncharacterized protein n=3 Tax=Gossypium TaxID=3633 RepID=A0A7J9MH70_GOSSC|nr:hypothetical protein [Gossypium lobatum]MBA0870116.1 hypothetical protein [Gossypium schwendimanii]